ncbi:MAG: hypothetical protein KDK64_07855 [Chlamydiia bacterium]|nr:hypothetical protein [Chlamydiia bacterium]
MKIDFFKIKAASPLKHSHPGFDSFVLSMEKLVRETIPESVIEMHETSHFIPVDSSFERLHQALPILNLSEEEDAPCTLSLTVLTREENTHGIGLFLCDMISQKLLPGKKVPITFLRSLSFKFIVKPKERYYVIEFFIEVENLKQLYMIKKNFPHFAEEVRLTILGVERARKVVCAKKHSIEEKRMLLSENLESLLKKPSGSFEASLYHDVQILLLKALYDHNPNKIPDHILPYIDTKPETFDHLIYKEMEKLSSLFHDAFASPRKLTHLSKTLSYLYLFRKILTHSIHAKPEERHFSFKLLYTKVQNIPTLAILIGVNLTESDEVLELKDVLEGVLAIVPRVSLVEGSNIVDEEGREGVRLLYFEVQKSDQTSFTSEEIKGLKKRLPKEIQNKIHLPEIARSAIDEEKMRSILALARELTSAHDRSQVVIQFHNEHEGHYAFSVILARVRKAQEEALKLSSSPPITIRKQERKVAGILNKRFVKEIYLYEMTIRKEGRDLAKARSDLFAFLKSHVPYLHDFNGGMVCMKYKNLQAFKALLKEPMQDRLIENYFYSISPPYFQSLIPPQVLKDHFEQFLKALDQEFLIEKTHILKKECPHHILITIATPDKGEVEQIRERIPLGKDGVALTEVKVFDLHLLGLILPKAEARIVEILDDLALFV